MKEYRLELHFPLGQLPMENTMMDQKGERGGMFPQRTHSVCWEQVGTSHRQSCLPWGRGEGVGRGWGGGVTPHRSHRFRSRRSTLSSNGSLADPVQSARQTHTFYVRRPILFTFQLQRPLVRLCTSSLSGNTRKEGMSGEGRKRHNQRCTGSAVQKDVRCKMPLCLDHISGEPVAAFP